MPKWEYKVDYMNNASTATRLVELEEALNAYGAEGWELLSTALSVTGYVTLFFGREINPKLTKKVS